MSGMISSAMVFDMLRRAYKRDRSNRYRLNQPWSLPRLTGPVPDYAGKYVVIRDGVITILPNQNCDGATLAPDKIGRWNLVAAAIAHDAIYAELDAIAAAWGCSRAQVRRLADDVFYGIALARAPHWLARIYWHGIRAFGGIAHAAGKLLALALLMSCIAGCAGCRSPVNPFDPSVPLEDPDYDKIAVLTPAP